VIVICMYTSLLLVVYRSIAPQVCVGEGQGSEDGVGECYKDLCLCVKP
jgi:hypothetical protein